MSRFLASLLVLPLLSGCIMAVSAPRTAPETPAVEPVAAAEQSLPLEIHYVRNSAEYRAVFEQTYRLATSVLESRIAEREPGTWAVVVDADETLISNSEQSKERALAGRDGYFEEDWDEWVNRKSAPALPGVKPFLERVHELGGQVAVVTNRRNSHCPQTAENLDALGLPYDVMLCRGETRDKQPRWTSVENGTASEELPALEIVMWIGDNIHDFPGADQALRFADSEAFADFGDVFFILPNPLYGSWEDNSRD